MMFTSVHIVLKSYITELDKFGTKIGAPPHVVTFVNSGKSRWRIFLGFKDRLVGLNNEQKKLN